jgi:hypothetical protein
VEIPQKICRGRENGRAKNDGFSKSVNFFAKDGRERVALQRRHNLPVTGCYRLLYNPVCRESCWLLKLRMGAIAVENIHFSTFSTGFSTALFHREESVWIYILVYII